MPKITTTQRLTEIVLGEPLGPFVLSRRPTAWRVIARDLFFATDGKVDISGESLRAWYGAEDARAASTPLVATKAKDAA